MSSVDVVVPCYNYARYLQGCVGSILAQQDVDVRVLILDDSSTDNSEEVGRQLAAQDRRVEYRRHATNCGHIATYNEGLLGWASAEYSLLLSADDLLTAGALARATQLMDEMQDVGMTYGTARLIMGEGDPPPAEPAEPVARDGHRVIPGVRYIERVCAAGNGVPTPTAVVRTALQKQIGGYDPKLPHSGDMQMWLKFAAHSRIGVIGATQAYYRVHSRNMSRQYYSAILSDRREQFEACRSVCDAVESELPAFRGWLGTMAARLSMEAVGFASSALERGDLQAYTTCLQFAEALHPEITSSRHWRRVKLKRVLGATLSRLASSVLAQLRATESQQPSTRRMVVGWWPEADEAS
jgi:hypothetical protein